MAASLSLALLRIRSVAGERVDMSVSWQEIYVDLCTCVRFKLFILAHGYVATCIQLEN